MCQCCQSQCYCPQNYLDVVASKSACSLRNSHISSASPAHVQCSAVGGPERVPGFEHWHTTHQRNSTTIRNPTPVNMRPTTPARVRAPFPEPQRLRSEDSTGWLLEGFCVIERGGQFRKGYPDRQPDCSHTHSAQGYSNKQQLDADQMRNSAFGPV